MSEKDDCPDVMDRQPSASGAVTGRGSTSKPKTVSCLAWPERRKALLYPVLLLCGVMGVLPVAARAEQASDPSSASAGQLDAGTDHTCALAQGTVRCWGFGAAGQLGYGSTNTIGDDETPGSAGPVNLGSGRGVTAISAGLAHTCALLDDSTVRCWGFGADGQLGYGNISSIGDDEGAGSAGPVDLGLGRTVTAISAGAYHTCAVLNGGSLRCWGNDRYGQLGYYRVDSIGDNETPGSVEPVDLGPGRTATAITASTRHTCALMDDGNVRCWGSGVNGQLGYGNMVSVGGGGDTPASAGPVDLGAGRTAEAITAGALHTCAVLDNGTVRCWGFNQNGQLGYGATSTIGDTETPGSVAPVNLAPGRTARAIAAGEDHTCALLDNGTVRCWGNGTQGRLGYGNADSIGDDETPGSVAPVNLGPGRTAVAISAGGAQTCARLDDASVRCWGYGGNGRLGLCSGRSIGDDEAPGSVGPVALLGPSCPESGTAGVNPVGQPPTDPVAAPTERAPAAQRLRAPMASRAQAERLRGLRRCFAKADRHARRELGRTRRIKGSRGRRAGRHARFHGSRSRRWCLRRYGRTPGPIKNLSARWTSATTIVLTFDTASTAGRAGPAARGYLIKQSRRPIRNARDFRRAQTLCKGSCNFAAINRVGGKLTLAITDLHPRGAYYYAIRARDNVSRRLGPRSKTVKARTLGEGPDSKGAAAGAPTRAVGLRRLAPRPHPAQRGHRVAPPQ